MGSETAISQYLSAVLADGDPALLAAALGDIARARGMAQIANAAGCSGLTWHIRKNTCWFMSRYFLRLNTGYFYWFTFNAFAGAAWRDLDITLSGGAGLTLNGLANHLSTPKL